MSAHFAFGPQEDDAIIKHRLLTRTTTTRGEPPLKKLQKKFMSFATEIEKDADNTSDCERLYKAFLQEINTFELPLLKSKAVVDANIREKESFNELQVEIERQILQKSARMENKHSQGQWIEQALQLLDPCLPPVAGGGSFGNIHPETQ
uniref:Uncharacterized protein n=1 Tax=Setaria viridis TaxID=4556 RepID=A0A4U6WCC8_SETVI|nr:hypothetical protein SEVIR_1G226800v2 [Setaria viridis]